MVRLTHLPNNRPNGMHFVASPATTEFAKRHTLQPGDIVSFKHHGFLLSSKKPKFPVIHRLRTDITWEDVQNNWKEGKSVPSGERGIITLSTSNERL